MDTGAVNAAYQAWRDEQEPRERFKKRSDETWGRVRRAWEAGETGASLARRFDVGLDNLWRRRATEGWQRGRKADPVPEPAEGWDRYGEAKRDAFLMTLEVERTVALQLVAAMQGEALDTVTVPLWHLGFILKWRADNLTPETAARDRAWAATRGGWTERLWHHGGQLCPLERLDQEIIWAKRDDWREDVGLPPGKAEHVP